MDTLDMDTYKICEVANKYFYKKGRTAKFIEIEDKIISTNNPASIYYFAKYVAGVDIGKLTDGIIATKNAEYIYEFAKTVKGANIDKLTDSIIATKNAEYIYKFAKDVVVGANIGKLTDAIISTGDLEYIYYFARYIKGADKGKLSRAYQEINAKKKKADSIDKKMDEIIESL